MNRRKAIRNLGLAVPGSLMLPSLLACKDESDPTPQIPFDGKVIVIGAGVAGLYAASLLDQRGVNVEILEASTVHGGRIRAAASFADFPIELGADFVQGDNSVWYQLIQNKGFSFASGSADEVWMIDDLAKNLSEISDDSDVGLVQDFVGNLANFNGTDRSVAQAITDDGIGDRVAHILNGKVGNRYGSDNDKLGILGIAQELALSEVGQDRFTVVGKDHLAILESEFFSILSKIQYEAQITSIDYSGDLVQLSDAGGNNYEADMVIIAVPISVLKDEDINFAPALPTDMRIGISTFSMDPGFKVALRFNRNFWGDNVRSVFADGIVPEYVSVGLGRSERNKVLMANINGSSATGLLGMEDADIVSMLLADLDRIFGNEIATTNIFDSLVMNWSNEPFIRGAYSYAPVGAADNRALIAQSVSDKLFFAGEATNLKGNSGTVNGALESAERVVEEIVNVLVPE